MGKYNNKNIILEATNIFEDAAEYSEYELLGYYRIVRALCKRLKCGCKEKIRVVKIQEILNMLDNRKQYILRKRFWESYTRNEIGNMLCVSAERIRQLEALVLERLEFIVLKKEEAEQGIPIEVLNLNSREYRGLKRAGINTINRLNILSKDELINLKGIGKNSVANIRNNLKEFVNILPLVDQEYLMKFPVTLLSFSTRVNNALNRQGILTVQQLLKLTPQEIYRMKGIGTKCYDEIEAKKQELVSICVEYRDEENECFLETLEISARTMRVVKISGVKTMEEFMRLTRNDVMQVWYAGEKTWQEIYGCQNKLKCSEI